MRFLGSLWWQWHSTRFGLLFVNPAYAANLDHVRSISVLLKPLRPMLTIPAIVRKFQVSNWIGLPIIYLRHALRFLSAECRQPCKECFTLLRPVQSVISDYFFRYAEHFRY